MPDIYVSSSGVWKKITSVYVSSGGVWKRVTSGYVSSGGFWKQFFSTVVSKPPNIPTSPATSGVTSTNITFSWTAPTADSTHLAATGYEYYTSTTNTTPTVAGTATALTSISFTYSVSSAPVAQYFWVRASNADGFSAYTSSVTATPTAVKPPNDPTDVAAVKNATTPSTQIDVSWTASAVDSTHLAATGYDIYYTSGSTQPTSPTSGTTATTTSTTASKTITSLSNSTKYWFWVRGTNADGKSGWAGPANATTDAAPVTGPAAPSPSLSAGAYTRSLTTTLTRISNTSKTQAWEYNMTRVATITWTAVSGATSYDVYYTTGAAPSDATAGDYHPTGVSQAITFYALDTAYTWNFYVRSVNASGKSAWVATSTMDVVALAVSNFAIRIYRGNGTAFDPPSNPVSVTDLSYPWTGLTNRGNPNASPFTAEGHYAYIALRINSSNLTATSATV